VMDDIDINSNNKKYKLSHKLGQGSFGQIFYAISLKTNQQIAIKLEK